MMKRFALAVAVAVPFHSASSQATDSTNVPTYQRSELVATALAWIAPGVGHLYADERRRGETILVVGSLTFVAFTWAMIDVVRSLGCLTSGDCDNAPVLWHAYAQGTMVAVGVGAWAFGVYDSHRAVRRQRRLRNGPGGRSDPELSLFISRGPGASSLAVGIRWTVGSRIRYT